MKGEELQDLSVDGRLLQQLHKCREEGSLRRLTVSRGLVDFCSNDYLGFARSSVHGEQAPQEGGGGLGGATGSRLLSGNSARHETLEEEIARFHGAEAALLFNSGFDANLGLLSAVARRGDTILYDELSHASVRDGARLSLARSYSFRHNNAEDLKVKIRAARGSCFVAVESVYSMDGDFAPLSEFAALCLESGAALLVDEAHATGVFGKHGSGLVQAGSLEDRVFARVHTFGKALGCHGAAVVGSSLLRRYLINFCRPFIYSTALPVAAVERIRTAYRWLAVCDDRRAALGELIARFRSAAQAHGIPGLLKSESSIQSIVVAGNGNVRDFAAQLNAEGFDVRPILSPTVARGSERLRVCLHAFNSAPEVASLLALLGACFRGDSCAANL